MITAIHQAPEMRQISESARQRAIIHWLRLCVTPFAFHIPNGGLRSKASAGKLKADGVLAGVPDIGVPLPHGKILWVEVKAPGGCLSPDQKAFRDHVMSTGGMWALAYDIPGVERACRLYDIPTRAVGV